ncbi:hypothetical protein CYMTET_34333 [Cymbomonas tetramitiformis]|uniref:Uncharacterized protein n=1 Tax=Cymbomonas tetramitiformis TaxID=36881 RepID=A0AAE0KQA4_9CHLO|nr:hypothetical protein CYMTET_34333 [Cymbomonas tetramitiformis]
MGQCASKSKSPPSDGSDPALSQAPDLEISASPGASGIPEQALSVAYRNFDEGTLSAKEFAHAFNLPPENPYLSQLMSIMDTENARGDEKAGFVEFVMTMAAFSFGVTNRSEAPARFCWQLVNWRQGDLISKDSLVKVLKAMNVSKEAAFAREIVDLASEQKDVFDFATFQNVIYSKPKYASLQKATLLYNGLKVLY